MKKILFLLLIFSFTTLFAKVQGKGHYYVNTKTLKVRLAPTTKSLHSYSIYENHKVRVYEIKNNWARISKYKTTTVKGKFTKAAKWVFGEYLSPQKLKHKKKRKKASAKVTPKKKASTKKQSSYNKTKLTRAISKSDNYAKFSIAFKVAAQKLLQDGTCKISDFSKTRGWIELTKDELYFTYCGGFRKKNKIYLNVKTNILQTFK